MSLVKFEICVEANKNFSFINIVYFEIKEDK